jgi:hypothetical protein
MMFEVLGSALFLFEDNASADDGKHAGRRGKGVCRDLEDVLRQHREIGKHAWGTYFLLAFLELRASQSSSAQWIRSHTLVCLAPRSATGPSV